MWMVSLISLYLFAASPIEHLQIMAHGEVLLVDDSHLPVKYFLKLQNSLIAQGHDVQINNITDASWAAVTLDPKRLGTNLRFSILGPHLTEFAVQNLEIFADKNIFIKGQRARVYWRRQGGLRYTFDLSAIESQSQLIFNDEITIDVDDKRKIERIKFERWNFIGAKKFEHWVLMDNWFFAGTKSGRRCQHIW